MKHHIMFYIPVTCKLKKTLIPIKGKKQKTKISQVKPKNEESREGSRGLD